MGFGTQPAVGQHLDHIAGSRTLAPARGAGRLAAGRSGHGRKALIECAGMLAYDVGSLVDELEDRQLRDCLQLPSADEQASKDRSDRPRGAIGRLPRILAQAGAQQHWARAPSQ